MSESAVIGDDMSQLSASRRTHPDEASPLFDLVEALRGRGLGHLHLHEDGAAIADLSAAIAINPNDVRSYRYRAVAYEGLNDIRHADLDDATVTRLDPGGLTVHR